VLPEKARDILSRVLVGALFALMSMNLLAEFLRTGHVTGLLLLLSESLVIVLTVFRRRARLTHRSVTAAVITTISLAGPPLLRARDAAPLLPDMVTAVVTALGVLIVIVGKLTLGRSFGIVPANRGIVARGPYNVVRHPIYLGYIIAHVAFLGAHPTPMNVAVVLVADTALILRALIEEKVLGADGDYQAYCRRVAWHLVPGVF
jgi:protein-S-isoprenylcysteine O-methyltransferase Ste14